MTFHDAGASTTAEPPDINLHDMDVFARGLPHEWFTWLRANAPVYHHDEPDGPGFWVLSKHADITTVSRRAAIFRSDDQYGGPTGLTGAERSRMLSAAKGAKSLPHMDPPEHTAIRNLVERGFRQRAINALEDRLRAMAATAIDRGLEMGECDFVVDLAGEMPLQTIAELVGLPEADRPEMFTYAMANLGADDPEYMKDAAAYVEAREGLQRYALQLAADRRGCPRDDIMTTLATAETEDGPLEDQQIALLFELFVGAGNQTTRTAISQGMVGLLDNPDQYQELVRDPSLMPTAIEEILRWSTPVTYFRRMAVEDFEIRGQLIQAGEAVTMWYISGNRDEEVFADPFQFDIHRTPNDHMAFGAGGPHFCLGSRLARLELRVFFEELVKRVRSVEALGDPIPLRANHFNAIKHLPVRLEPAA